jgi:ABC-type nitrate/sulfonate/bicarbonate transport system substrate-binding protein
LAAFVLIVTPAWAAEPVPFRLGEAAPANTYLAIWMARDAGLYTAEGLTLESVHMAGGAEAAQGLETGAIHIMHVGMSTVVRANAMGHDLRIVGSLSNIIRFTFFAAFGKNNGDEIRGGAIGISSAGSESDATSTMALRRLGLTRADVTFAEIGRDRLEPLIRGQVAATMLGEPERSQASAAGLTPLVDLYAERIPWLFSGLVVDARYLAANRDAVKAFLRATIEGNYIAISDENAAKAVLARELGLSDPAIIESSYENFRAETPVNAEIDFEGAENVLAALEELAGGRGVEAFVDAGLVDELHAEGFFEAMRAKYRTQ